MSKTIITKLTFTLILAVALLFNACASSSVSEELSSAVSSSEQTQPEISSSAPTADETTMVGYGAVGALADTDLTTEKMLLYAVQDEYLAHGEYTAIIEKFGDQNPYTNIMEAEETHLNALREVYDALGMTFPEDTSADHIIISETLLEAAQTGVQAEIDNIAMYERFLTYELPDNVKAVFESLKTASESHLKAFQTQVDKLS
ncbi:MAG TPA: DUF2202 domain-containing protein [Oscillospiraceae bacterium]|nr:DUF2202 domain-containing protein [Oscillospiraceae bacterium]HPK35597.1 DUF2202 domain-containing protein [Oscillospiraceae bacterium]HPR75866.1 DUF2202 domain-containing protein [Oscillospiraceae bacterium]